MRELSPRPTSPETGVGAGVSEYSAASLPGDYEVRSSLRSPSTLAAPQFPAMGTIRIRVVSLIFSSAFFQVRLPPKGRQPWERPPAPKPHALTSVPLTLRLPVYFWYSFPRNRPESAWGGAPSPWSFLCLPPRDSTRTWAIPGGPRKLVLQRRSQSQCVNQKG